MAVAVAIGFVCGFTSWLATFDARYHEQDFGVWWLAAKVLREGRDPYAAIHSIGGLADGARVVFHPLPFFYPLPSALVVLPLSFVSVQVAAGIFMGLSCAILAYAVTGRDWWPLLIFLSGSMVNAVLACQWSPLITAGLFLPALAWLGVFKPNLGLAVLAHRWNWRALGIMAAIGAASLPVMWRWPLEWLSVAAHSPYHYAHAGAPGGGALLFLALLRWRRADARLLFLMSVIPVTPGLADSLPLFAIPRTRAQMLGLVVLSVIAFLAIDHYSFVFQNTEYLHEARPRLLWLLYLPTLALVLSRPNARDA